MNAQFQKEGVQKRGTGFKIRAYLSARPSTHLTIHPSVYIIFMEIHKMSV